MKKREPSLTVGGTKIGITIMENNMAIPQKINNRNAIWFSNLITGYLAKEYKKFSKKDLFETRYAPLYLLKHPI